MKAGKLDRRITIERAANVVNAFNEQVATWTALQSVRATVYPISDGERWRAGEVGATVTHRFRVRWTSILAAVTPKDRINYNGQIFDISGCKEIGRHEGIEFTASARAE